MKHIEVEKYLLTLPGATLSIQWGSDRIFKVGGKMFVGMGDYRDGKGSLSFKASEESFRILTDLPGIIPAPYLARASWVQLDKPTRLKAAELKAYLARAHAIVASGLPKKTQKQLGIVP